MKIEVQALATDEQFRDAVALQKSIWGFEDIELLPVRLFVVATKVGGQAFGAYDAARMVAFCLAIPGMKPGGRSYLHSHMLGVAPEYRNAGIGRLLKLRQREDALSRPVDLIEWTFDPLEIKNAWFNLERLGAIVRRYVRNQYGTTSSHLHGGLPTDRCTAEWWIDSERVNSMLDGKPLFRPAIEARIPVPAAISTIRLKDPKQGRAIQQEIGRQFLECFDRGLAVIGFERTEGEGIYLLGRLP
ncbi:MAG: acetyltransferase [Bryobacteraceae bacterium]